MFLCHAASPGIAMFPSHTASTGTWYSFLEHDLRREERQYFHSVLLEKNLSLSFEDNFLKCFRFYSMTFINRSTWWGKNIVRLHFFKYILTFLPTLWNVYLKCCFKTFSLVYFLTIQVQESNNICCLDTEAPWNIKTWRHCTHVEKYTSIYLFFLVFVNLTQT